MRRYTWRTATLEVVLILLAIVYLLPLGIMIGESLRVPGSGAPGTPEWQLTIEHYGEAWERAGLGAAMLSSTIVTVVSVALLVVVAVLLAYAIARLGARVSNFLFWLVMAGLFIPFQIAMIPLYMFMRSIGLVGNIGGPIVFYVGTLLPLATFLFVGFIRALPREYEEAAWVDGASSIRTFWSVVFPLLRPVTGTVIIVNSIVIWNDLLTPLLYLSGSGQQTIPVAIQVFVGQFSSNWSLVFAALAIGILPIVTLFLFLQRTVIKGFATGLKG